MKQWMILFALLALVRFGYGQAELANHKVFTSLAEASQHRNGVYRLKINNFNASKDGNVLIGFPNLIALDLSGSRLPFPPLGLNKLSKLQYLNVSNTDIGYIYSAIKKLPKLKELVAANTSLSYGELNKIRRKTSIKVVTDLSKASPIFTQSGQSTNEVKSTPNVTKVQQNTRVVRQSTRTTVQTTTAPSNQKFAGQKLGKASDGLVIYNPENVPVKENETVWLHSKGGKSYACKKKKAYGLISENGELITLLPSNYKIYNQIFSEGLIGFSDNSKTSKKHGFLDKAGKVAIATQFDGVKPFKNGLSIAKLNGKYGAIDQAGNWVIQPIYDRISDFIHPNYAFFKKDGSKNYGIITRAGVELSHDAFTFKEYKFMLNNTHFINQVFDAGLLASKKDGKWGFKDMKGNWAVPSTYDEAHQFSNGFAVVGKEIAVGKMRYGLLDKTGKLVLPIAHYTISTAYANSYTQGGNVSISASKDGQWTIYNEKLEPIMGPLSELNGRKVLTLLPFKQDAAMVMLSTSEKEDCYHPASTLSQTTFINRKGQFLFEPRFMLADNVNQNGLIMFTNFDTRILGSFLDPAARAAYDNQVKRFNESCGGSQIGYMNLKGEVVLQVAGKAPTECASFGYENTRVLVETAYGTKRQYFERFIKKGEKGENTITYYGTMIEPTLRIDPYAAYKIEYPSHIQGHRVNDGRGSMTNLQFINLKTGKVTYENGQANAFILINEGIGAVYPAGYVIEVEEL